MYIYNYVCLFVVLNLWPKEVPNCNFIQLDINKAFDYVIVPPNEKKKIIKLMQYVKLTPIICLLI